MSGFLRTLQIAIWIASGFLLGLIFMSNTEPLQINFVFFKTPSAEKAIVVLIAVLAGIIAALFALAPSLWRHSRESRLLRRELARKSAELEELRKQSLASKTVKAEEPAEQ